MPFVLKFVAKVHSRRGGFLTMLPEKVILGMSGQAYVMRMQMMWIGGVMLYLVGSAGAATLYMPSQYSSYVGSLGMGNILCDLEHL
jgi:hypothetical protein